MAIIEQEIETKVIPVELPVILDPRVEKGATLLDEYEPGWADRIDLDVFNLSSSEQCVLGQIGLCNDFWKQAKKLGLGLNKIGVREHGFWPKSAPNSGDWDIYDAGLLEADWRLLILSRQTS